MLRHQIKMPVLRWFETPAACSFTCFDILLSSDLQTQVKTTSVFSFPDSFHVVIAISPFT